jgi:hypothetical protein
MKAAGGIKLVTMRSLTFAFLAVSTAMQVFAEEAPSQGVRGKLLQVLSGPVVIGTIDRARVEVSAEKDADSLHFQLDTFFKQPIFKQPILAIANGKSVHVSYRRHTCLIRSYTPGKCFCCLGETDVDFHEDDESKAK